MSPEEIAALDKELKQIDGGAPLWSLDRLFFASDDREAVGKLKASAHELARAKERFAEDQKELWEKSLGKQLRLAVDRAKRMSGKS